MLRSYKYILHFFAKVSLADYLSSKCNAAVKNEKGGNPTVMEGAVEKGGNPTVMEGAVSVKTSSQSLAPSFTFGFLPFSTLY